MKSTNYKNLLISSFILVFCIGLVSAFDFPHTIVTIDFTGNLTNISQMQDVDTSGVTNGQLLIWNSATAAWEPASAGAGDILAVNTDGPYLSGGTTSGTADLLVNETYLNETITTIATGLVGGNASFNQTLTDTLYADISVTGGNSSWNETYADTLYADISVTGDNSSWNQSLADTLYSTGAHTTIWDTLFNNTLTNFLTTWFLARDTDDLTEGSINLYDNQSWNESHADTIYATIGSGGNESFNQSLTDSLYYSITNPSGFYNSSDFSISDYFTSAQILGFNYYNSSDFVIGDYSTTSQANLLYATIDEPLWTANETTVARIGDCPEGEFVQNTTTGGVECATPGGAGGGTVTSVDTGDVYLTGGPITSTGTITFNESKLNITGDLRYAPINYGDDWNETYADTLYADISVTGDNSSWNQTYANTLYADISITGTVTNIATDNTYLTGGEITTTGTISLNETVLNESIRTIDTATNTSMKNYVDTQDIIFNDSASAYTDSKLITTFFNATTVDPVTGTPAGTVDDIQAYDGISYNVSEVGSDMELIVNFTGIDSFNQLIVRYKSSSTESHTMAIQIWSYDDSEWEDYRTLGNTENVYNIFTMSIFDIDEHISGGVVQIRFFSENGPPSTTHLHQFDWVAISKGPATPSSDETDPFAIHRDGMTPFEANWNQGAFNFTNIDSWFMGTANSSDYWDELDTINTTQMENDNGQLHILLSWFTDTWNSIFATKTTDDLTEGSTNRYDNSSWNASALDNVAYTDIEETFEDNIILNENVTFKNMTYVFNGSHNIFDS